jgi:hypothetical protein
MTWAATIICIVLLVALRLLIPPVPRMARLFGKRTAILLASIGVAAGIVAIFLVH